MKHKTLYHNAEIYTCNLRDEIARAMVVSEKQILYVGTYREACRLLDDDTEVVDMQSKAIIPGFFDSLVHLQGSIEEKAGKYPLLVEDSTLSNCAQNFANECVKKGITSACCATDYGAESIRTVTRSALKGNLGIRATLLVGDPQNPASTDALHRRMLDCGICTGLGDGHVRIGAAVVCANDKNSMENNISRLLEAGMQLYFHAENEQELIDALSVYEWASKNESAIKRAKITLNFPVCEKTAQRILTLGLVVVTSPQLWQNGASQIAQTVQMLQNRSCTVAFASGAQKADEISPLNVLQEFASASSFSQFSLLQGLRAYSYSGAYGCFLEDKVGSLEWGKAADFCLLSSSLSDISPHSLHAIEIEKTIVGGKIVYDKSNSADEKTSVKQFPVTFAK